MEVKSSNEDLQDRIQFFFTNSIAVQICHHFQSVQTYRDDSNRSHHLPPPKKNQRCVGLVNLGGEAVSFLSMAHIYTCMLYIIVHYVENVCARFG